LQALQLFLVAPAFLLILRISLWKAGPVTISPSLAKVRRNPRIAQSSVKVIDMLLFVLFLASQMLPPEEGISVAKGTIC
jgi:hypothetical protein